MAVLSNHGKKRMKERVGIPLKATMASTERALREGLNREELSGSLRRYIDHLYYGDQSLRKKNIKIYGNMVYIFDRMVLVTVLMLPSRYIKTVENIKRKKEKEKKDEMA